MSNESKLSAAPTEQLGATLEHLESYLKEIEDDSLRLKQQLLTTRQAQKNVIKEINTNKRELERRRADLIRSFIARDYQTLITTDEPIVYALSAVVASLWIHNIGRSKWVRTVHEDLNSLAMGEKGRSVLQVTRSDTHADIIINPDGIYTICLRQNDGNAEAIKLVNEAQSLPEDLISEGYEASTNDFAFQIAARNGEPPVATPVLLAFFNGDEKPMQKPAVIAYPFKPPCLSSPLYQAYVNIYSEVDYVLQRGAIGIHSSSGKIESIERINER